MNLKLLLVLTVLFLPACSGRITKDDSPANDLLALKANAERNLRPRLLPNGELYCVELALTESQQDDCAGDLEDGFFASEQDKARGLASVVKGVERLILQRNPCGFFARLFKQERCQ